MGKKTGGPWGLVLLGFALGAVFVFLLVKYTGIWTPEAPPIVTPPVVAPPTPPEEVKPPELPPEEIVLPPPSKLPRIAIVIDDMGQDMKKLRELVKIDSPITIAVLPNLRYSKETANEAHKNGLEVLLHMPMEPKDLNDNDPGAGALLTAMSSEDIKRRLEDDFKSIPFADGVNNHMGSKFTEDEARMKEVLSFIRNRNIFFLDSRTSSNSVAGKLARELGVRSADRNVFLDNSRDVKYIKGQIAEAVSIARKKGSAIAIGHPYPETIEALKESAASLSGSVEVVKLSELVRK